jgi:hypothetical protein
MQARFVPKREKSTPIDQASECVVLQGYSDRSIDPSNQHYYPVYNVQQQLDSFNSNIPHRLLARTTCLEEKDPM